MGVSQAFVNHLFVMVMVESNRQLRDVVGGILQNPQNCFKRKCDFIRKDNYSSELP